VGSGRAGPPPVALDDPRMTSGLDELVENSDDIVRVQESGALDPDRFASELVYHGEKAELSAIDRLIENEVVAPNVVRIVRSIFVGRAPAR
jgi:hypothetical protein